MKVKPFRKIVPNDGTVSQKQLFEIHSLGSSPIVTSGSRADLSISSEKVPRLINPKQFEAINYRRRVKTCIEKARIKSGRPVDGRRVGTFKYIGKHVHASNRARGLTGTFSQEGIKTLTDIDGFRSIGN